MTSLYVKLIGRAIMNFPGSHGYSIIKNLLALPKTLALPIVYILLAVCQTWPTNNFCGTMESSLGYPTISLDYLDPGYSTNGNLTIS